MILLTTRPVSIDSSSCHASSDTRGLNIRRKGSGSRSWGSAYYWTEKKIFPRTAREQDGVERFLSFFFPRRRPRARQSTLDPRRYNVARANSLIKDQLRCGWEGEGKNNSDKHNRIACGAEWRTAAQNRIFPRTGVSAAPLRKRPLAVRDSLTA